MALIHAQSDSATKPLARSWADVARRATSALQAGQEPVPETEGKSRPWRDFSSASLPSTGKPAARPWKEVAQRMASAFEKGASEADDSECEPLADGDPEECAGLDVGPRGTKRRFCFGEVLVMLGHYGWLMAFEDIDHPAAQQNGGHIYVHRRDISGGCSLAKGDHVSFYLYADEQGLGAEDCTLQGWEESASWPAPPSGLNPNAADFVPGAWQSIEELAAYAVVAPPLNNLAVNLDYWTDSESDSDESETDASESGADAGCDSAPLTLKTKPSSRGTASTCASSDSEGSGRRRRRCRKPAVMMVTPPSAPPPGLGPLLPPGLTPLSVAPPPGLLAPPPGLELPSPPGL